MLGQNNKNRPPAINDRKSYTGTHALGVTNKKKKIQQVHQLLEIEGLKEPNHKKTTGGKKQKRQVTRQLITGHYYPLLDKRVTCKNMPNICALCAL